MGQVMIKKDYTIVTDSCVDLSPEYIENLGLTVIPLGFVFRDDKEYKNYPDGREISFHDFYDKVRSGEQPRTNQVNVTSYIETIEPILQTGKDVLILSFSSALSGTYQSAVIAAAELKEKYPESNIVAVDSLSASMGEGLLAFHAANKKAEGMDMDELIEWIEKNRLRLCHWFTVDDLNHLKRGGRVSPAAALFGTLLSIKPILHVDNEGKLIPVTKVRGRRQSLDALADKMAETYDTSEPSQTVFISHGDSPDDANYLAEKVKSKINVKEVIINYVGPVIGAHSGPGTIALFFLGKER
jgi:DegV family protein with EDD domain